MLLHGVGASRAVWRYVTPAPAADHHLIAPDLPGGVIWGWRDRIVPISTLRHIRAPRPDLVLVTIPRAAHVPQVERPAEFVAAVRRLLARLT